MMKNTCCNILRKLHIRLFKFDHFVVPEYFATTETKNPKGLI